MLSVIHLQMALQIAVVAVMFERWQRSGMVFAWYGAWLDRLAGGGKEWLAKPLGYCAQCFAGQVSLWVMFARLYFGWEPLSLFAAKAVSAVFLSGLFSLLLDRGLSRLDRT